MPCKLLFLSVALLAAACFTRSNLPPSVSASNIRRINVGMSRIEVEAILGPPIEVQTGDPQWFGRGYTTLVYFRRLQHPLQYPMLWVHLRNGRVEEVYAKHHNFFDSDEIYVANKERHSESPRFATTFP